MKITGKQLAAARALLGWSQSHLAEAADVALSTIVTWELEQHHPRTATVERVRQAIEVRGVEFLNGGQPGVRLKAKQAAEQESAGE